MNAVLHPSAAPLIKDGERTPLDAAAALLAPPIHDTIIGADELIAIFDALTDTLFFLKDMRGRYTHANLTMARRLGLKHREDAIGHTPAELYPAALGNSYLEQDRRVLAGEVIENLLELQLFPNRAPGWCLTHKRPLREGDAIRGLVGISRDLGQRPNRDPIYTSLRAALESIQRHYTENVRIHLLAREVGMSLVQFERHFKRVFQLTPQQMLTKLRIELAMKLLREAGSVAGIGQTCGFTDQSAFARQFKATVGMSPGRYRSTLIGAPAQAPDPRHKTAGHYHAVDRSPGRADCMT